MIHFLLDTNILSEFSRIGEPNPNVSLWLKAANDEHLFTSVLTFAEIRRGIELLAPGKRRSQLESWQQDFGASFDTRLLPVTKSIADRWATLSAEAQKQGIQISNFDGLIAATAIEHGLTLATRNVKDFRFLGLDIVNPWES